MPYDQNLAERVKAILKDYPGWVEKKMFGGTGYILRGNLACGLQGNDLIVRVGVDKGKAALSQPFVRPFMGVPGRTMAGWVLVSPEGISTENELRYWVELGCNFAMSLPEKQ